MQTRFSTVLAVAALLCLALVATSQRGGRGYFCPHTLQYRSQSERTIWATGIPLYRSGYQTSRTRLIEFITEKGFVQVETNTPEQWVCTHHWNQAWRDGDGDMYRVLFRDVDQRIEWSENHPETAALYWSEGFRYLRSSSTAEQEIGVAILRMGWRLDDRDELQAYIEGYVELKKNGR